jgi:rubrerythrin
MKALSNTKTEQNLLKSFIFESQSRTLYDFFSEQAKEEGFIQISNIFSEVALNEKEHAKRFLKFLK